ncbi:hypothetical protein AB8880_02050 [Alphaproteobacteria bacterium LSUCC0684]
MKTPEEMLVLQHRYTDQVVLVPLQQYRRYSADRYRNWRLKGQGAFIAPPEFTMKSLVESPQPIRMEELS